VKTKLIVLGAIIGTAALIYISIFIIAPPKPIIEIKGEPLVTISDTGSEMTSVVILNTLFTAWVVAAMLFVLLIWIVRKRSMVPSGIYNLFEGLLEGILSLVENIGGKQHARKFFPLIATFFIYIAFANWMSLTPLFNTVGMYVPLHADEHGFHEHAVVFKDSGIIPFGAESVDVHADECEAGVAGDACREAAIEEATEESAGPGEKIGVLFPFLRGINTDLMTTLSFALVSAFFVEYWGISTLGFFRYGSKFFNLKGGPIGFFVGILEFVAEIGRLISFSFRLFGNMMAGEILLLVMTFLVAVASPIMVIFYGLELFVGAIQAFVFGTLTLVFGVLAVTAHDDHDHDAHDPESLAAHGHAGTEAHSH
jgi:F-type H+-transporting ATPase subunit a